MAYYGHSKEVISIHAPREGSDKLKDRDKREKQKFQSTLPVRGATRTSRV